MPTLDIAEILSQMMEVEFYSINDQQSYRGMKGYIDAVGLSATLLPVRTIGRTTRHLSIAKSEYIVWDEAHLDHIFRIAGALIASPAEAVFVDYGANVEAGQIPLMEILYASGCYGEAWELCQLLHEREHLYSPPGTRLRNHLASAFPEVESTAINHEELARLYVFFHEVGHCLEPLDEDRYDALEAEATAMLNLYMLYCRQTDIAYHHNIDMQHWLRYTQQLWVHDANGRSTEKGFTEQDLLVGDVLIRPPLKLGEIARQLPREDISDTLFREVAADLFALSCIVQLVDSVRPEGLRLDEAQFVAGYLAALNIAMATLLDLRTRCSSFSSCRIYRPEPEFDVKLRSFAWRQSVEQNLALRVNNGHTYSHRELNTESFIWWKLHEPHRMLIKRHEQHFGSSDLGMAARVWSVGLDLFTTRANRGDTDSRTATRILDQYARMLAWTRGDAIKPRQTVEERALESADRAAFLRLSGWSLRDRKWVRAASH